MVRVSRFARVAEHSRQQPTPQNKALQIYRQLDYYGSSTEPEADQDVAESKTFIQSEGRKPEKSDNYNTAERAAQE